MRPFLAFVICVSILGGLQLYMVARTQPARALPPMEEPAADRFEIEITLTFAAGPDPFSLSESDPSSLFVQYRGQTIIERKDVIQAGTIIREPIAGLVVGQNELFLQVSPHETDALVARAIRVRIFRNSDVVNEQTIWSEPGEPVGGIVLISAGSTLQPQHLHEHQ